MDVKINKLYEMFLYAQKVGFDYAVVYSLRTPPKLKEFLDDLDPDLGLDYSGQSYYGLDALRRRVVETQGYQVTEDNILITAGTNEANFLVMMQTVEPGDEVVIDSPSWPQPYEICTALGAKVKVIKRQESLGWGIDLDELKKMVSPKTRLIFVCSPNNPTGAVFKEEEMRRICEIARANDAYLLSDEVYRGLEWDGPRSPAAVNYYEKAISASSVSKGLGLQGIRTGWMATQDKKLIDKCLILREDTSEVMNVLGEYVALGALKPGKYEKLLNEAKAEARAGWAVVSDWISKSKVFHWVKPKAGFLGFVRYDLDIGSEDLSKRLLAEPYRTFVMPGIAYGFEKYIRVGVGGADIPQITEGLKQIDRFVQDFYRFK
jgi:aspartate/methionine/tyrosine aminotransferase